MKTLIKNISRIFFAGFAVIALVGSTTQTASAAVSMNSLSNDCRTFTVANHTTQEGYGNPCWTGTNISANTGEVFNLAIYFNNSGDTTAQNVSVRVSDMRGTQSGKTTVIGQLYVNGNAVANGSANITFPSNAKIVFDGAYIQTQSSGSFRSISGGTGIFQAGGISIGSVAPGWANQGVVKAVFKVESAGNNGGGGTNDASLSVTTDRVQIVDATNGNVRFTGSYSTNRSSADVHFNYRKIGNNPSSTNRVTRNGSAGSFTADVNGLSAGKYEFQACAKVSGAEDCDTWKSFTIDGRDIDNPNYDSISVSTGSYQIVSTKNGNVDLKGSYSSNYDGRANVYIEYRNMNGGSTRTTGNATYSNESRSFSSVVTGLSTGTYQYRACAYNNSSDDCGSWREFYLNRSNDVIDNNDNSPSVTTLNPIQVFSNSVALDGYYAMNGCSGSTWFEYGRTQSLGSRSAATSRSSNGSGSMSQAVAGLNSGTTYYFRAVAENCKGTTYGSILSFTTDTTKVTPPTSGGGKTIIKKEVVNIGAGSRYIKLMIDNGRDSVMKGDDVIYDVYWENLTKHDIHDLVLEVSLPEGLQIVSSDQGQLDRTANKVYVNIKKLEGFEKDDMTVRAKVVGTARLIDGDSITARAILAFENPEVNQAQENAIAYDSDTYFVQKVVSGGLFAGTFLPATLVGWLLLILLLIIVVILLRYAIRREEHHHHYPEVKKEPAHENNNEDYIPYRPTPKE